MARVRLLLCLLALWLVLEQVAVSAETQLPQVVPARFGVRIERGVMIPMRDGRRLSADLIRPDAEGRFPIIVEYIPYRKDDVSRGAHESHYYFAERGFIGVRLDVTGTGGSEGVNTDEYMAIEQQDGYDAIEWLAAQPYSNGKVGMFGTSYGGFTAVQVAMRRPPHLAGIVPIYATDDRYTDDCHYTPGGNMRMYYDVGTYGGNMVAMNALPPPPEFAGAEWANLWRSRLEQNEPYLLQWMAHQVQGDYWRGASLRPGYERIECPVFLIAGWRDGYVNAMLRMFTQLKAPTRLLVGPWVHSRPHVSIPGPRIDYLNEVCRFFGSCLRNDGTDASSWTEEPALTVYMQEYATPSRTLDITPGHWRNERQFPPEGRSDLTLYLEEGGRLVAEVADTSEQSLDEFQYVPTVGTANAFWSAGGITYYLPEDQRADEALSLVYTSEPFQQKTHLLGWPQVTLYASSSATVATFVCKLADVAPDGHSALIIDGSLNGTRRGSLTEPEPMEPGVIYELDVPMPPTGWVIKPGHRLRLAISGSDFPNLWPTPEPATNQVYRGGRGGGRLSKVILPVVPAATLPAPSFLPPPQLKKFGTSYGEPPTQQVLRDQVTGAVTVLNRRAGRTVLEDNLGTLASESRFRCTASALDPSQASIVGTHKYALTREDGTFEITAESSIRATREAFHITIDLNVERNGQLFFHRQWLASEPRRGQ